MSRTIITTRETTWGTSSSATFTDTFILSSIGPLTTIFTPPSECLNTWYATNFKLELGMISRADCFPSGFIPGNYWTSGYFSPGVCPSSYTAAAPMDLWWTAGGRSGSHCCPIGYYLPAVLTGSCFLPLSSTITSIYTDGVRPSTTVRSGVFSEIWAPAIPVFDRNPNESTGASAQTTESTTNQPSHTDAPTPGGSVSSSQPIRSGTPPSNGDPTPPRSNHTLTIAIATAVPIIFIGLVVLVLLFLRRRARQNTRTAADPTNYLPELEGNGLDANKSGARVWPAPIELPTIPAPVELPTGPALPVELLADHPSATSVSPPVVTAELPVTASADSPTPGNPPTETPEVTVNTGSGASALTVPTRKGVPAVAQQEDQEMEWLNRELERVNERRENLRKLEALNDEHRELERRINERKGSRRVDM